MSAAAQDRRRRNLAAIHAAKRDLGMDDDSYRMMLREIGKVDSAKDLDAQGLYAVMEHLRRVGWQRAPRKRVAQHPGTPHNLDSEAMLQKIEALLADMQLPWSYADAIAKQQKGIERVAWLRNQDDLKAVIAALHVEQEKRRLLGALDELLKDRGMTREELAQQCGLKNNWHRRRVTLTVLIERLATGRI